MKYFSSKIKYVYNIIFNTFLKVQIKGVKSELNRLTYISSPWIQLKKG